MKKIGYLSNHIVTCSFICLYFLHGIESDLWCSYSLSIYYQGKVMARNIELFMRTQAGIIQFRFENNDTFRSNTYFLGTVYNTNYLDIKDMPSDFYWILMEPHLTVIITIIANTTIIFVIIMIYCFVKRILSHHIDSPSLQPSPHENNVNSIPISIHPMEFVYEEINQPEINQQKSSTDTVNPEGLKNLNKRNNHYAVYADVE